MRLFQKSLYAALISTGGFVLSFLHLDSQLSAGSLDALPTEGSLVVGLAAFSLLSWTVANVAHRSEVRRRTMRRRRQVASEFRTGQSTGLRAA